MALLLCACGDDKAAHKAVVEDIDFAKIERHINDTSSLNTREATLYAEILAQSRENDYTLISTKELNRRINMGEKFTIIASVPRGIYILGFIQGAKNFGFRVEYSGIWEDDVLDSASQDKFREFLGKVDTSIIIYDNGDGSGKVATLWAKKLGYINVAYLVGGFQAWRSNGFLVSFDMPECCKK